MATKTKYTKKAKQPKISVVVFSYNFEKYIGECIQSLVNQTLKPYEIIVCDDHSTDGSWDIIQEFESKYPDIIRKHRHPENIGHIKNGKFCKDQAKGTHVAVIDGDDRWLPEKLELEWRTLQKNPKAKVAYSNVIMIDENGNKTGQWVNDSDPKPPSGNVFAEVFGKRFFERHRSVFRNQLMDRKAMLEAGYDAGDIPIHADWNLKIRLSAKYEVAYSGKPLVEYREHPGGIHNTGRPNIYESTKLVIEKNMHLLKNRLPEEQKYILENLKSLLVQELAYSQKLENKNVRPHIEENKFSIRNNRGENLIFLISQPRSGSTLLQRILGANEQIYTVSEPWIMLQPLFALKERGMQAKYEWELGKNALQDLLKTVPEKEALYYRAVRAMGEVIYNRLLETSGKTYFLDKTPRYYLVIPELMKAFPEAKFLFILRNPLAVLSSTLSSWFNNDIKLLRRSKNYMDLIEAPALILDGIYQLKDKATVLHYEGLVNNTQVEIKKVCLTLNLPFHNSMIEYGNYPKLKGRFGDQIEVNQHNEPVKTSLEKWKTHLNSDPELRKFAIEYIQFLGVQKLSALGYSYSDSLNDLKLSGRSGEMPDEVAYAASHDMAAVVKNGFIPEKHYRPLSDKEYASSYLNGEEDADAAKEMYQNAQMLVEKGMDNAAIMALVKLLESYPEFALAHNDLGVLYYKAGKKEDAFEHYKKAAELQPENITFQKNLADFYYFEQGEMEEAMKIYVNILAKNPKDVETLLILGNICVSLKKIEDAKVFYSRVQELAPDNAEIQDLLGSINAKHSTRDSICASKKVDEILTVNTDLSLNKNRVSEEDKQHRKQEFIQSPLIDNNAIALYFQPPSGNTEKYIAVKPLKSIGNTLSSYETLKNYEIKDFGKGFPAAESILRHIFSTKLAKKLSFKDNFWLTVIGIDIECEISSTSGGFFDELKPKILEDISPEFARGETNERKAAIYSYKELIASGRDMGLPLYSSGAVLNKAGASVDPKSIYMMDGARRIAAAALCHRRNVTIRLLVLEDEYPQLLCKAPLVKMHQEIVSLSWFNKYQSIPLLNVKGERTLKRFELMDMSLLREQVVMDFGCNIGQASLKALQAGARQVIGIEGQKDTWDVACRLGKFSGFPNIRYLQVDFNDIHFDRMIDSEYPDKADYAFFFSLYRTKELTQRDRLFEYIINKTKKGIFFEGHAHPKIDTIDYYDWLFQCFGLTYKYLGMSEGALRPLFFIPLSSTGPKDSVGRHASVKTSEIKCSGMSDYPALVSAIVSTYKSEKFIEGRLQDLLQQTLNDRLEIIIVDSNSPENERAIVEKYMRENENIKYIRTNTCETVYQAWNRGIKAARGKYLTNANTDDRLRPDALEILAQELEQNQSVVLVYGDFFITNIENMHYIGHIRCGYSIKPDYEPDIMLSGCHMGPQPMWRKSIHDKLGYFDDSLESAGDYEFWCRIATKYDMKHVNQFLGLYYHNPEGIVNRNVTKNNRETSLVKEKYAHLLPPPVKHSPTGFYYRQAIEKNHYVNICVITYNRLSFSKQSIKALIKFTDYPYVLTVVDNNSQDGTREYLSELYRTGIVKNLVLLDKNVGVAKASNLAWHLEPQAEYYLKLDNDIVIQKPHWLTNMIRVIDAVPEAGAVGYNFEPASFPLSIMNNIAVRIKNGTLGGACILIPKRTEKLLGYWSEDYGLYSEEDADYGNRILLGGLMNIYMEDENIGIHLPAGKAAKIDPVTFSAKDGIEEKTKKCNGRRYNF